MRRLVVLATTVAAAFALTAGPALACGGLIGPNGAVNLIRTTTLAAYHDGVEHYVTTFEFGGATGNFGSLVPLPGVPTKVERGGDWTLQRLQREVQPPVLARAIGGVAATAAESAQVRVIIETTIDALDITVLEGGAAAVGKWAKDNGFRLPPDAPEMLEFYAARSPYFMAAKFDADAATKRGQAVGDGTPVHLTIPIDNPWVPLRILALGKDASEGIEADVFLLTDQRPRLLPSPVTSDFGALVRRPGLVLERSEQASFNLTEDLRRDKGMEWMPRKMWLSYLRVDSSAAGLTYDLAVDADGRETPSTVAAGLTSPKPATNAIGPALMIAAVCILLAGGCVAVAVVRR